MLIGALPWEKESALHVVTRCLVGFYTDAIIVLIFVVLIKNALAVWAVDIRDQVLVMDYACHVKKVIIK